MEVIASQTVFYSNQASIILARLKDQREHPYWSYILPKIYKISVNKLEKIFILEKFSHNHYKFEK